jgi:hypothetical protein
MSPEDRSRNQSTAASLLIALQKIILFEANDSLNIVKFSKLFDFLYLSTSYVKHEAYLLLLLFASAEHEY